MQTGETMTIVRGEEELLERTAHLFATATDITCAANDAFTWAAAQGSAAHRAAVRTPRPGDVSLRKLYRPSALLDPRAAREVERVRDVNGAQVRITTDEINETIILDRRLVILAGDLSGGLRSYTVLTQREAVQGVMSLFDAAWRSATDLAVFDARTSEVRRLAPQVLDLLGQGVKDETAARMLGLGVRTYRRRVAELMDALGAESRFQAGARARELGLV